MILSPPFLPLTRTSEGDDDADFIDQNMPLVTDNQGVVLGVFPVSCNLHWHGGCHVSAPVDPATGAAWPVRAIADGVLCYKRAPAHRPTDTTQHPHPLHHTDAWTDNGVVVLKHTTEVGDGATVVFYSIYMHLGQVSLAATPGQAVYRKDILGKAGTIYDKAHSIHLEIVADPAQLAALAPGTVNDYNPATAHGSTQSVWGDTYFHLPAGQPVYRSNPQRPAAQDYAPDPHEDTSLEYVATRFHTTVEALAALNHTTVTSLYDWFQQWHDYHYRHHPAPRTMTLKVPQFYDTTVTTNEDAGPNPVLHACTTTGEALIVALHLSPSSHTFTTTEQGEPLRHASVSLSDAESEYQLYHDATTLYPHCPSAGYELLRFGRVLGPDALHADDTDIRGRHTHFRNIAYRDAQGQEGTGWVNLYDPAIHVFSDADFAANLGWQHIDASSDDVRCHAPAIYVQLLKAWLAEHQDLVQAELRAFAPELGSPLAPDPMATPLGVMNTAKLEDILQDAPVRERLGKLICTFPTEWSAATAEQRWGWLKQPADSEEITARKPFTDEQFNRMMTHVKALCFWEEAVAAGQMEGISSTHVHFDPRTFIKQFRKCGWLSEPELTQLLPMSAMRKSHGEWVSEGVSINQDNRPVIQNNRVELNKSLRKFGIASSPLRLAAFFGNAVQETQWFGKLYEGDSTAWYHPWDGRGFLQLTGPDNYIKYWRFRGREISESLAKALNTAAVTAHHDKSNVALQDAKHAGVTAEIVQWRKEMVDIQFVDASDSAGAYWAWTGAVSFADIPPIMKRETITVDKTAHAYYSCVPFGQVAATVNFGSPVRDVSKIARVKGIVARYQAYTNALMVLADRVDFPDAQGNPCDIPEGYKRRKSLKH